MLRNIIKLCDSTAQHCKNIFNYNQTFNIKRINGYNICLSSTKQFHTTNTRNDLMDFFDDKKNWGENEVKVGRAWQLDELRIKSNVDLHKLWYILLKERNMLMTMETECNDKMRLFPSPERIDKVKISMQNLESIVRERNRAFHELETGETGERPGRLVPNQLGINFYYKEFEHIVPTYLNRKWHKTHKFGINSKAARKFVLLYREKLYNVKRRAKNRQRNEVTMLLRRNPNLDLNLLREKFPDVNINKILQDDKARGHYVPESNKS